MAMLKGLGIAAQLGFNVLEVESDSATMVSWATSRCSMQWEYAYLLH